MVIYDFEDIVYPYDPANAKIENSWYFNNLAQYADTEYNLVLKPYAYSNLLEKSNDIYGWVNNDGSGCCYAFKLKNHYRISKVTADVRAISYNANELVAISLQPIYLESPNTFIQSTDYYAQRDNGAAEIAQNRTTHITDNNWHTIEFPTYNLEIATHFNIYCAGRRSVEVKNIKIEGYKIIESPSGGAGSGYIGNSLLSNKKMVGFNVPTSSAEGTKTESVNDVSASAVSGKPKSGNGFAKIKFLGGTPFTNKPIKELLKTLDFTHTVNGRAQTTPGITTIADVSSDYYGSNYVINVGQKNGSNPIWDNTNEKITIPNPETTGYIETTSYIPIARITCTNINFDIAYYDYWTIAVAFCKVDNNEVIVSQQIIRYTGSGVDPGNYRTASVNLNCNCEADYIAISYGDGRNPNTTMIDISNITLSGHY